LIKVPAITEPHQGTSYNPPTEDRHELLLRAASIEQRRVDAAKSLAAVKTKMESCRTTENFEDISVAVGMTVQDLGEDESEAVPSNNFSYTSPAPIRKTKSQRNKEARLAAEVNDISTSICTWLMTITHRDAFLLNEFTREDCLPP